jgi:hypothetical protein
MNETTNQSLSGGDNSINIQAGGDVNFQFPSSKKTLAIVALVAVTIWFALWMFEIVSWPEWPLKWRRIKSGDLSSVVIELDQAYKGVGANPLDPNDPNTDRVNAKFTENYTKGGTRVVWAGKVDYVVIASRYLELTLDESSLSAIRDALGDDRVDSIQQRTRISCTFAKGQFDETVQVGKIVEVTGRVVIFNRKEIILKSCHPLQQNSVPQK